MEEWVLIVTEWVEVIDAATLASASEQQGKLMASRSSDLACAPILELLMCLNQDLALVSQLNLDVLEDT